MFLTFTHQEANPECHLFVFVSKLCSPKIRSFKLTSVPSLDYITWNACVFTNYSHIFSRFSMQKTEALEKKFKREVARWYFQYTFFKVNLHLQSIQNISEMEISFCSSFCPPPKQLYFLLEYVRIQEINCSPFFFFFSLINITGHKDSLS